MAHLLFPDQVTSIARMRGGEPVFNVTCIGHALNDEFAHVSHEDLLGEGLTPGEWHPVYEPKRMHHLRTRFRTNLRVAAGSSANTARVVARMHAPAALMTAVGGLDDGGSRFVGQHVRGGIAVGVPLAQKDRYTGVSINLLTPDGERTFVSDQTGERPEAVLCPDDVDGAVIRRSRVILLQATQITKANGLEVMESAAGIARAEGRLVALSLNHINAGVIAKDGPKLRNFLAQHVDICLGNHREMMLAMDESDPAQAARSLSTEVQVVVGMTRGASGAMVVRRRLGRWIPAVETDDGNSVGAGDAFAAGFLYGLSAGQSLGVAASVGVRSAAATINQNASSLSKRADRSSLI